MKKINYYLAIGMMLMFVTGFAQTSNNTKSKSKTTTTKSNTTKHLLDDKVETLSVNSKYDLVAGEKVIAIEDFSTNDIGSFPANWNTNSSAEVVTLSNQEGKWLQINQKGAFKLDFINSLPDDFTFEFDVICTQPYNFMSSGLYVAFAKLKNPSADYVTWIDYAAKNYGVKILLEPAAPGVGEYSTGNSRFYAYNPNLPELKNNIKQKEFFHESKPKAHIAIWRQKERISVYVNQQKLYDIPKAMLSDGYNSIFFATKNIKENDKLFISNIKLATGVSNAKAKLIEEGKYSTNGILFDINEAVIKPESYGVLLSIGKLLKENKSLTIKVVGHTDNDGNHSKNIELSKQRALAVKDYLVKNFGIDSDNIEIDGKGSSQPIDNKNTKEAKANNRRVEFIKL